MPDHQRRLAAALEWVEATPDARLVVSMPPGHGKSEVCVSGVAWMLARGWAWDRPIHRAAVVSYNERLARGYSGSVRDRCASGWLARMYGLPGLAGDAEGEWRWRGEPVSRPTCQGIGVLGPLTGRHVDLLLVDDPIKTAEDAHSELYRERLWRWWTTVARERLQPGGRVVVVATRWVEDDLSGRLLRGGGWRELTLPALDEEGRALWPERYPVEHLQRVRADVGERVWQAMYQGDPTPEAGDLWRREWFDAAAYPPGRAPWCPVTVTAWDTAYETSRSADYTAWCRVGLDDQGHAWVLAAGRRRMEFPALLRAIEAGAGGPADEPAVVEQAASGRSAVQVLRRECRRPVIAIEAERDKAARARAVTDLAEAGRVHLPAGEAWAEELLGELTAFPTGRHDDRHDALVHALTWLRRRARRAEYAPMGGIRA